VVNGDNASGSGPWREAAIVPHGDVVARTSPGLFGFFTSNYDPGMKPKTMFLITAIVAGAFGLGLVAAPAVLLAWFGLAPGTSAIIQARESGSLLLGLAVVNWMARDIPGGAATTAILLGDLASQSLAFFLNTRAAVQGWLPWRAFPGVGIHGLLAVGYLSALIRLRRQR